MSFFQSRYLIYLLLLVPGFLPTRILAAAEVSAAAFNLLDNQDLEFPNPPLLSTKTPEYQVTYVENVGRRITGTISIKFLSSRENVDGSS